MGDFEGLHFLAAFEGENADSDDDNASWCSELASEANDDPFSSSTTQPDLLEWSSEDTSSPKPFPFTGECGMKFNIEHPQPIDIFNCICKPEFMTKMILGTNAYARKQQKLDEEHYGHWKTLTMNEMRQFIGLVFHTGTIRMNNLSDYWSTEKLIDLKIFRATMTLNRFLRILTALRFGNERIHQEDGVNSSMAFNLMLGDFMVAMRSVCYPGRDLVIDNCQVVTKQDIFPLEGFDLTFAKPQMLIHSLSEPNGLVHNVLISGVTKINYDETVSSLTFDKRKRGHSIFLERMIDLRLIFDSFADEFFKSQKKLFWINFFSFTTAPIRSSASNSGRPRKFSFRNQKTRQEETATTKCLKNFERGSFGKQNLVLGMHQRKFQRCEILNRSLKFYLSERYKKGLKTARAQYTI
ncbi:unnamed protein product [Nesidiocoris tenuis]|uniref:PiggyBac transposable element-derived protein domain-containing protein n=1 Tax=Nesidiocoris tenuis TaxID=355587 RepID=A0A6H5HUW6_9HEMI|nr:unnamed protein product [Nesidiocoris tenuis]